MEEQTPQQIVTHNLNNRIGYPMALTYMAADQTLTFVAKKDSIRIGEKIEWLVDFFVIQDIIEQRPAKGDHVDDVEFYKVKVEKLKLNVAAADTTTNK